MILVYFNIFGNIQYGESLTADTTTTAAGAVQLTEQSATTRPELISSATLQTKEASKNKAEIIGEDEVAAEQELPYDTTTTTGKIAAALITGKIINFNLSMCNIKI